jgi:hypothetical protein
MMYVIQSSERQFLQEPHGVTSQKMAFFKECRSLGFFPELLVYIPLLGIDEHLNPHHIPNNVPLYSSAYIVKPMKC